MRHALNYEQQGFTQTLADHGTSFCNALDIHLQPRHILELLHHVTSANTALLTSGKCSLLSSQYGERA
jgi:hypothetical protein